MANDIKLRIGADTSELERAFGALIKKIQGDADKLKLGPAASKAAPGTESVAAAAQSNRALNQRIREEKAGLEIINRELSKKKALVDDIAKRQEAAVRGSREELALIQQRQRAEERLQQTQKVAQIQQTNFNKAQEASSRARGMGGPGGGGPNMPSSGITDAMGLARFLGIPLPLLAGAATAVAGGTALEKTRSYFMEASTRARTTEASAFQMQGQGGQRMQSLLTGGASEELMFNPLREQAAKIADDRMKERLESSFRLFTRPIQTLLGKRTYTGTGINRQSEQMGWGTAGTEAEVEAQQRQERAALQAEQFNALKTGPEGAMRTALGNQYLQNYQRDLDFQRQMGLGTAGFRGQFQSPTGQFTGGFLGGIHGAGFTTEQGMGMASGIMGAGGSTRSAVGNAALGLQAQRNLDITNAGNILGKLSGGLGGAETTKEAFVKILAEGTRAGLDDSEFREENRRFVETAAQAVTAAGVTTAGGAEQVLSQFGRFFSDKTMTGMQAGQNAYELYRQTSMATTGPRATLRAAGMLTDPTISRLSRDSREALFNMPIDQLTSDNPAIIAMAAQARVTPDELIKAQNRVTSKSANLFKNSDIATQRLAEVKKKYGVSSAVGFQGPLPQGAYEEIGKALGESNIAQIKEHPELGQDQRTASAYSEALSRGDARAQQQALEDAKKQQLEAKTTGRPEDETAKVQAEASRMANQLFMSVKDSIVPATGAANDFATAINKLMTAMRSATPEQSAKLFQTFNNTYGNTSPTQPSAGSPASGPGASQ